MIILSATVVSDLISRVGLKNFFIQLNQRLIQDFNIWHEFHKSARHTIKLKHGVIELMPIATEEYYSFKYVNGHPENHLQQKSTVVAFGMLADSVTGYPLMLSSMTLLTAIRTAAVSAIASVYLAKKQSRCIAMIGCGSQSTFQILAHELYFDLQEVRYFDLKPRAMDRFAKNFVNAAFTLHPAANILDAIDGADIIICATSAHGKNILFKNTDLIPGQHICAIGGDATGKTELDSKILTSSKVVVEYFAQTQYEGEIQNLGDAAAENVYAELWELVCGLKPGRSNDSENTLFDSVGFALEDFSALRLCYSLAQELNIGHELNLVSHDLEQSESLYGLLL